MSLKLLLARHGSSDAYEQIDAEEEIFRQTKSSPLSQLGITQAQKLAQQVTVYRPDAMIVSPYLRARLTGEIVAEFNPLFPNVVDELKEIRRVVDGKSIYSQLNLDYKRWRGETIRNGDMKSKFHPQDESFGEFHSRVNKIKSWLSQEFDNQTVLVVGHSQFFSMFISSVILGDKPHPLALFESFNRHFMSHGAITVVTYDYRHRWQMKPGHFNITSHLD